MIELRAASRKRESAEVRGGDEGTTWEARYLEQRERWEAGRVEERDPAENKMSV